MKKFILLPLLAGLFTLASINTADAQTITNDTKCDFRVTVTYSLPGCTTVAAQLTTTVGANSSVTLTLPPGMVIREASGSYTTIVYPFNIGVPCTGLPASDTVVCSGTPSCNDYRAGINIGGTLVVIE